MNDLPAIRAALAVRPGDRVIIELASWPGDDEAKRLREIAEDKLGVPVLLVFGATVTGIREDAA